MEIENKDCIDAMKNLKDNSIDVMINCVFPYYDTVAVAASSVGKNFFGFELNEDYKKEVERILKTK